MEYPLPKPSALSRDISSSSQISKTAIRSSSDGFPVFSASHLVEPSVLRMQNGQRQPRAKRVGLNADVGRDSAALQ